MKKISFIVFLILGLSVMAFANEVSSEQSEMTQTEESLEAVVDEAHESVPRRQRKNKEESVEIRAKNSINNEAREYHSRAERKVASNLAMIISSTPLLTFGSWFFGFSGYLFSLQDTLSVTAGAPSCIAAGLGLFTAGMALLLVGAVHLPRNLSQSNDEELIKRLKKMNRTLENLSIVSGVFSATGLASLGMGIGFMCYGNYVKGDENYKGDLAYGMYGTGVALTAIGTIFTFSFLPIFISSLAVMCANNVKIDNITPDIALIHDDKKGLNEGYGISMGMRIKI